MLFAYLQQTQRFLADEGEKDHNHADLVHYVNAARDRVAIRTGCLAAIVPVTLTAGTNTIVLSSLALSAGYGAVINVRAIYRSPAFGLSFLPLENRPWQYFALYYLNSGAIGFPEVWSQFTPGDAGTLYISPTPAVAAAVQLEATYTPSALATDTDPEILSIPWTPAIPYYSTYLALMRAQKGDIAAKYLELFERMLAEGRAGVTPGTLPENFMPQGAV